MKTLERRLGLGSVIAISIAAMIGSGLFVLPGIAVSQTGSSVWLAYLAAGLCVLPAALCKAELATAMPESGGTYIYIDRAFGPILGTITGLGLWLSLLFKSTFALEGFGAYLDVMTEVPIKPVALALLVFITSMNVLGVRKVGKAQMGVVVIALAALSVLAGYGLTVLRPQSVQPEFSGGVSGFWGTVSLVYISYAGVTKVAAIAEEVENPGRNLPIGILLSLFIVTTLYCVVTFVLVNQVPLERLGGDLRPIYTMTREMLGPAVGIGAALLGVLTMTSMSNSGLLAASRFPFAMSRQGALPSVFSYISTRFTTPVPAILLTAGIMTLTILVLDVVTIVKFASALMILGFLEVNITVVALRESSTQWYKPTFRAPLYPLVQVVGVGLSVWLLIMLGVKSLIAAAVVVALGCALFYFSGKQENRRGVLGRMGPRRELLKAPVPQPHLVLPRRASVVVPLLGRAYGAEALAELGDVLAGGAKVEVVHIAEVPEQLSLEEDLEEDPIVGSLRRRINALGQRSEHDIDFDSVATHDHIRMIHEISARVHCEWLVMEWRGRTERGVLPFNPLGWLVDHLSCNLAVYKDVGSRSVQEILAFTEPGPHDALVAITAEQVALAHDARLTFVRFVSDGEEPRVALERQYLEQLGSLCTRTPHIRIVRGTNELAAVAALTAHFDLLVTSAAPDIRWWSPLRVSAAERLMRRAACSVLRLKAPRRLIDRSVAHRTASDRDSSQDLGSQPLTSALLRQCVDARLPAMSKTALFQHFADKLSTALNQPAAQIEEALWDRERTQNTALDRGLAVPHSTLEGIERTCLGVFTAAQGIDYRAPDGGLVDVFVVVVSPPSDRKSHLQVLSNLAHLVLETPFLERLRAADNSNELLAVLLAASHAAPKRSGITRKQDSPPERKDMSV